MNILLPDSWLREYLDTKATPVQIKECLSLCGPSVERINKIENDFIYDIEITSNRVDMASVYGIAREACAILPRFGISAKLKNLEIKNPAKPQTILPMQVTDPEMICNRIMGVVMEINLMKPSPAYIKDRIEKSGVRSLNNLVDITNYVMLELGHPCHVFDYDRIKTHKFLIRFAKKNETIITLDNKKYLLSDEDVIIDDTTGRVIDLPGIMGTENSVVNQNTKRIFFFIESNNPVLIRKTSMRYGIRSMAATINEKHPDPELVQTTLMRGIELYQELAGGKVAGDIINIFPNPPTLQKIKVSTEFINERLGIELKPQEIINILQSLGFNHQPASPPASPNRGKSQGGPLTNNHQLIITSPTYRQFDVSIPEDIVEEVARIYGYHNLPNRLMTGEIPIMEKLPILSLEEKIKIALKYWGHTEIYNYSFISKDLIEKSLLEVSDHLNVANPLTSDIEFMRISLIPSMLETVAKNQFYSDNLQLFELANIYFPRKNDLPFEIPILTISNQKDFYVLKGIVETLLKEFGISDVIYNIPTKSGDFEGTWSHFWHPNQTVFLSRNGVNLGFIGKIHPTLTQNFQLKDDLYLAVLNVELISKYAKSLKHFVPISQYPAIVEDLTLEFPLKSNLKPVIDEIYQMSALVKNIGVLDRYQNSITLRITYQDVEKNLDGDIVQKIRTQILHTLKSKYNTFIKS